VAVTNDSSSNTTIARYDAEGQLVEVEEIRNATPVTGQWATWTYAYDALGNLETIFDAEGNETRMVHDQLGRRLAIQRDGRAWKYTYDHDGNLTSEQSPLPAGAS